MTTNMINLPIQPPIYPNSAALPPGVSAGSQAVVLSTPPTIYINDGTNWVLVTDGGTTQVNSVTSAGFGLTASPTSGDVILTLAQSILTSATPEFAGMGLGGALAASSILSLTSTSSGFLPPRMTTVQKNAIATPATGLVVYDTTVGELQFYNGTAWVGTNTSGVTSINSVANQTTVSATTGDVIVGTVQSIGTSSAVQFGSLALGSGLLTSAILSLTSTTAGFLPPRVTTTQKNAIATPATGLVVYDTTIGELQFYNGSAWVGTNTSGVTSILGTTNQITASASTGAVTLSLTNGISLGSYQAIASPVGGMIMPGGLGVGTSTLGSEKVQFLLNSTSSSFFKFTDASSGSNSCSILYGNDGNRAIYFRGTAASGPSDVTAFYEYDHFSWFTGNAAPASQTEKMRLLLNGNLGINDTAAGSKLSVVGNVNIGFPSGTGAPSNGLIVSGNTYIGASTQSTKLGILEVTDSTANYSLVCLATNASGSAGGGIWIGANKGSATSSGDRLGAIYFGGYNGTALTGQPVAINVFAAENFTGSATGSYFSFATTPVTTTTRTERARIGSQGGLILASGSNPTNLLDVPSGGTLTGAQIGFAAGTASPSNGLLVSGQVSIGSSTPVITNSKLEVASGWLFQTYNTGAFPTLTNVGGFTVGWNHSQSRGEVNFFDAYSGYNASSKAFDFWSVNATSDGFNRQVAIYNNGGISVGQTYSDSAPPGGGAIFEGNVGVGTSTVSSKLQASISSSSTTLGTALNTILENTYAFGFNTGVNIGTNIVFQYRATGDGITAPTVMGTIESRKSENSNTYRSYMAFMNRSGDALGNDNGIQEGMRLTWDKKLGINDTNPGTTLSVVGNMQVGYNSNTTVTALGLAVNAGICIGTTAFVNKLDVNGGAAIGTYAGVNTAPSNGLLVSGSVVFGGSSAPIANVPLTIQSNANAALNQLYVVGTGASDNNGFSMSMSNLAGGQQQGFSIRSVNNTDIYLNTQNSAKMHFGVSTLSTTGTITDHMVINSSGNVGIGANNPTNILQVGDAGRLRISNGITDYTLLGTIDTDGATNTRIVISGHDRPGQLGNIHYLATNTGDHIFSTTDSDTQVMRIKYTGLVGINDNNPGSLLSVVGSAQIGYGSGTVSHTNGLLVSGSTTIGNTSGNAKFNVYGARWTANNYFGVQSIYSTDEMGTNIGAGITFGGRYTSGVAGAFTEFAGISGVKENATNSDYAGALTFSTRPIVGGNFTEAMRITSVGNIGIQTTTPYTGGNASLTFACGNTLVGLQGLYTGSGNFPDDFYISNNYNFATTTVGNTSYGTSGISIGASQGGGGGYINFFTNIVNTAPTFRMTLDKSGNLGINDSGPGSKLSVVGSANIGFSAGTVAPSLGLIVSGQVGIGTNSVNSSTLTQITSSSSFPYSFYITGSNTSLDAGNNQIAINLYNTMNPTNDAGSVIGIISQPSYIASSTKTISVATAIHGNPVLNANVGTITNFYNIYAQAGSSNTGTVTNGYSIYAELPNYGTNKYCAYFGGIVGVGTTAPTASSILHVASTTKGSIPFPPMTTSQINAISSPAESLMAYDLTLHVPKYYNGTAWTAFGSGSGSGNTFQTISSSATVTGTSTTGINFVGCTAGSLTVSLPASIPAAGWCCYIKDQAEVASTNNITISGNGYNIGVGTSTFVLFTSGQGVMIYSNGSQYYPA